MKAKSGLQMVLIDKPPVSAPFKKCTTCCIVCVSVPPQATNKGDFRIEFKASVCAHFRPVLCFG